MNATRLATSCTILVLCVACLSPDLHGGTEPATTRPAKPIPVIYDSDIGDDIDDTWALGFLLCCPELDLKLVVGDQGKALYRAKLFAKFLERAGRTDVPVGIGLDVNARGGGAQSDWVKDYDLARYPGRVHKDGVQALIDTIMRSPQPITVIAVGPLPNIAEALKREPRIATKARFVGMHGSVRVGYGGNRKKISPEYNVRADAKSCQKAFTAPWDITITPLDTCGLVHLRGAKYRAVFAGPTPIAKAIIENYRIWSGPKKAQFFASRSSTLFDTVAVYLAFRQELCTMESLPIRVDDAGYTRIDPKAKKMHVATAWKDMGAFEDLLVARLTGGRQPADLPHGLPKGTTNLLRNAKMSGNLASFKKGTRGQADHVIFDPRAGRFAKPSQWHEYGVGMGGDLGVVPEDRPAYWQAEWKAPVRANLIQLSGVYPNQPQPRTAWKIETRRDGTWQTLARGVGGWYDTGLYTWGGAGKPARTFDAIRVAVFSKDDKTPIKSIHFRGEEGLSWLVAHCPPTPPKAKQK